MLVFHGLQGAKCRYSPPKDTRCQINHRNGVQEASSSNLDTRTNKTERTSVLSVLFFHCQYELEASCILIRLGNHAKHALLRVRISTLGPKNPEQYLLFWIFYFLVEEIRKSNAMRMSIAADGSTEANNNFCRRQKCKRISILGK